MGLFSSSKKIYVASTVYKMVDDDTPRASFMQEALTSTILSNGANVSLGQAIVDAHLRGPRSSQRSFFRWAKNNFDFGMPRAAINYTNVIDHSVVANHIETTIFNSDPDYEVTISIAFIGSADESYYAEQYLFANRPEIVDTDWAADYDAATGDIVIQYAPGTEYPAGTPITTESISVAGFNTSKSVLIAYYTVLNTATDVVDPTQVFIYEIGSGTAALDSFNVELDDGTGDREFYPFIPIRIDNKSVFESGSPAVNKEDEIRDAYEKAMGGDIDDLIEQVEDNESIDDIDYAYVVFGICLNDKTKFGKRYIFEFLRTLSQAQTTTAADYASYQSTNDAQGYHPVVAETLSRVNTSVANTGDGYVSGTDTATSSQAPQVTNVHLTLPSADLGVLDMKITWSDIQESRHTGVIKSGAKVGDVEVFLGETYQETVDVPIFGNRTIPIKNSVEKVTVRRQISQLEYIEIAASGLLHQNLIYEGKSVDIKGHEALEDEDDSGFILPLHEPTMRRMGVVASTEVARECHLIVFNSYKVVKKKWYQKGIFKIFAVVIIITAIVVLAVVTGGASLGPSAPILGGVLGSSAAIGASLGFSGLLAIAVGTAVNVIAAMIITQLVTLVAVELLGEKIGQILAAIVAVALSFNGGSFNFNSFSTNLSNIGTIDKLMTLTNAASDIVGVIQQDKLEKTLEQIKTVTEDYKDEMDRLKEQWEAFGFGDRVIDPIMLTDFTQLLHTQMGENFIMSPNFMESPDSFINRTLMTGSDLTELSLSMVNDFAELSLTLT